MRANKRDFIVIQSNNEFLRNRVGYVRCGIAPPGVKGWRLMGRWSRSRVFRHQRLGILTNFRYDSIGKSGQRYQSTLIFFTFLNFFQQFFSAFFRFFQVIFTWYNFSWINGRFVTVSRALIHLLGWCRTTFKLKKMLRVLLLRAELFKGAPKCFFLNNNKLGFIYLESTYYGFI